VVGMTAMMVTMALQLEKRSATPKPRALSFVWIDVGSSEGSYRRGDRAPVVQNERHRCCRMELKRAPLHHKE